MGYYCFTDIDRFVLSKLSVTVNVLESWVMRQKQDFVSVASDIWNIQNIRMKNMMESFKILAKRPLAWFLGWFALASPYNRWH